MDWIEFKNDKYPLFQSIGNASQFSIPFAKHYCKGTGYDIGFSREEWKYPGAIGIDQSLNNGFDANNLPDNIKVDYIYSSHCLEHTDSWYITLKYWMTKVRENGIIFLYLPDISNIYWRPWHNKNHKCVLTPDILRSFLIDHNIKNYLISSVDLNSSFIVVFENV